MVVLFWPMLRTAWARTLAIGAAVLLILGTCLDRVFLGVHYPTDVTVGVITGTGLVLASYAGYIGWSPPTPAD
jgi:membrane-associated phospholipid phosphatase